MKKAVLILSVFISVFFISSCDNSDINDEIYENDIQQTDKEDSINSNGSGNDRPSNGEN
ncbi:hypothetical protein ACSTS3_04730 [Aquimarina muelleri]|uniref:hypothetical protein n=1 Tax=Aquimarina muelleri TaxID=279356 RepID=UPI003F683510